MLKNPWRPTKIHHKTQKKTTSTKPKIGDRRRPTNSPQNPEKQQHPPLEIRRQYHKTQNWTKSQPPPEIPEKKSNRISATIHQIRPTTSINRSKSQPWSTIHHHHDPLVRRRRENRWEERKKKRKKEPHNHADLPLTLMPTPAKFVTHTTTTESTIKSQTKKKTTAIEISLPWCSDLGFVGEGGRTSSRGKGREKAEKWLEALQEWEIEERPGKEKEKNKKKRKRTPRNKKII